MSTIAVVAENGLALSLFMTVSDYTDACHHVRMAGN